MADENAKPEMWRCNTCNRQTAKRGRTAHYKFTADENHGPKGKLPEDFDKDAYFTPVKGEEESEGNGEADSSEESSQDSSSEPEDSTGGNGAEENDGDDSGNPSGGSKEGEGRDGGSNRPGPIARFVTWLTTPIGGE